MGCDIGFLKVLMKSSIGIGTTISAGVSRPATSSSSERSAASTRDEKEVPSWSRRRVDNLGEL
jgi:hypothetical protein